MNPLLELSGVDKRFGGLMAVDGMSFTIDDGEVVGLLGRSRRCAVPPGRGLQQGLRC